jgi:hypothetical protein
MSRAELRLQPGIAFGQLLEGDVFRDARARDADRAVPSPRRFESERSILAAEVKTEAS